MIHVLWPKVGGEDELSCPLRARRAWSSEEDVMLGTDRLETELVQLPRCDQDALRGGSEGCSPQLALSPLNEAVFMNTRARCTHLLTSPIRDPMPI